MWQAAGLLVDQARQLAADLLEANLDDVVLDTVAGRVPRRRHPGPVGRTGPTSPPAQPTAEPPASTGRGSGGNERRLLHAETDFQAIGADVPVRRPRGRGRGRHRDRQGHACTGLIAVDDAGTILNPLLADGQVHGGLAQGAAQALLEELRLRRRRQPAHRQLRRLRGDQRRRAAHLRAHRDGNPDPAQRAGRQGHRRVGHGRAPPRRCRTLPSTPLAHLGIRHLDMPLTPESVWRALQAQQVQPA